MFIYFVLISEIALVTTFLFLLFWLQDWTFIPYFKRKQDEKDLQKAERLLDDLPPGVVRFSFYDEEKTVS